MEEINKTQQQQQDTLKSTGSSGIASIQARPTVPSQIGIQRSYVPMHTISSSSMLQGFSAMNNPRYNNASFLANSNTNNTSGANLNGGDDKSQQITSQQSVGVFKSSKNSSPSQSSHWLTADFTASQLLTHEPLEFDPSVENSHEELHEFEQSKIFQSRNGAEPILNLFGSILGTATTPAASTPVGNATGLGISKGFSYSNKTSNSTNNTQEFRVRRPSTMGFLSRGFSEYPAMESPSKAKLNKIRTSILKSPRENLIHKQGFLIKLAKCLAMYGAPTHRLEYQLSAVSQVLNVTSTFFSLPGMIFISFGTDDDLSSSTHLIKISFGYNMGKLSQVNALCQNLAEKGISVDDAIDQLEYIRCQSADGILGHPIFSSRWMYLIVFPLQAFTLSNIAFGAKLFESLMSACLAIITALMAILAEIFPDFLFILDFTTALTLSFFARNLQWMISDVSNLGIQYGNGKCFNYLIVILSSMSMLLPGLGFTLSIVEISTKNMISGTVRLFTALYTSIMLGFGISLGTSVVLWNELPVLPSGNEECEISPNPLWNILFFPLLCSCFNYSFRARLSQYPIMTLTAAVAYTISSMFYIYLPKTGQVPIVISSFAVGIISNAYSRWFKDVAIAPLLSGILLLLPGSLGVKSSIGFLGANISDGSSFSFQMLIIGMSVTVGIFLSQLFVTSLPTKKQQVFQGL